MMFSPNLNSRENLPPQKWLVAVILLLLMPPVYAAEKNGFELDDSLIPAEEILHGGPPRDGIPAIDHPQFIKAADATFLKASDRVLGIVRGGEVRAYPIAILNWHEIVNDLFGEEPVVVSFCPLCGTGVAFSTETISTTDPSAKSDGSGFAGSGFGVSGLLYNSDVLLYDRETGSLWSQILAKAVSGPRRGMRLTMIPLQHTTWQDWKTRHSDTRVLSTDTGFTRDYSRDPYASYISDEGLYFPVKNRDPRYHPKERVLGIEVSGQYKAYAFQELAKTRGNINDVVAGKKISLSFNAEHQTAQVFDDQGKALPGIIAFWFAWFAFHPDTEVFQAP